MSQSPRTALITGATSGLGLALAKEMLRTSPCALILPVRNAQRGRDLRAALGPAADGRVQTPIMDLADLQSIRAFLQDLDASGDVPSVDILMLNAGVQSSTTTIQTRDGLERTFAVNHLAHHVLLRGLAPRLATGAVIGWVGSGTHHPEGAKRFGYTGAHYLAPEVLALGRFADAPSIAQASRNAYSTSKGLNIVSARHWARLTAHDPRRLKFFAFDPGLMPGTGLAREGGAVARWAWSHILPVVALFMKRTSTTARSSAMLARLLLGEQAFASGAYIEFTGADLQPHLPAAEDPYGRQLFAFSDRYA